MIATHAGAVAGAWIYYLAIEVSFVADFDAVAIEIFFCHSNYSRSTGLPRIMTLRTTR